MSDDLKKLYFERPLKNLNWGEIYLTFKCNHLCSFCHSCDMMPEDPSNEEIKEMILQSKEAGADKINFSGGEPTIHKNFLDFIIFAKNLGFKTINIKTNARAFKDLDFAKKAIENGINNMEISFLAHNEEIWDKICNSQGSFRECNTGTKKSNFT